MSDQDRISPYNINTISSGRVMRIIITIKYQLRDYKLIQYQILQTNITRTVWETVRRISDEILMISRERCVRIIIGDIISLFCQSFLLLQTEMRKKNAKKVLVIFRNLIIVITIIVVVIIIILQNKIFLQSLFCRIFRFLILVSFVIRSEITPKETRLIFTR